MVYGAPPHHRVRGCSGSSVARLLEAPVQEDQTGLVDGPSGKSEAFFSKRPVAAAVAAASCLDLSAEPDCWIKAGGVGAR